MKSCVLLTQKLLLLFQKSRRGIKYGTRIGVPCRLASMLLLLLLRGIPARATATATDAAAAAAAFFGCSRGSPVVGKCFHCSIPIHDIYPRRRHHQRMARAFWLGRVLVGETPGCGSPIMKTKRFEFHSFRE